MERDLLARFTGDNGGQLLQGKDSRPLPSPTLSLRVGSDEPQPDRMDVHGYAPQLAQAAASMEACPRPSASRVRFASPLASVVVPGHPAPLQRRPTDLRAGAGARPRAQGPSSAGVAQRPSMAPVPTLRPVGPTTMRQEHCWDACSHCAQLLQGLVGDLDRARAQVALLTCENESLRHRLKRAAAEAGTGAEAAGAAAASSARLHGAGGLRCRACRVRPATVVLVPREHLCLCGRCSDASRDDPAIACWVCRAAVPTRVPAAAPR